jgi:hypothetical protein
MMLLHQQFTVASHQVRFNHLLDGSTVAICMAPAIKKLPAAAERFL